MKALNLLLALSISTATVAQQKALPHGTVYGTKPTSTAPVAASKLEGYMGNKTRISTTIDGVVTKVTKTKGGWFIIDAGNGKTIVAHFKNYDVNIPTNLAGHTIIAEGVAQKQFIADDLQHLAGDTVAGKKQHTTKANPKQKVTFEVSGLMIDK